jgi:hypothetical protein
MKHTNETNFGGMIYMQSFMKIGKDVQEILRFCLRNLNGYNVGITNGRDLWIAPFKVGLFNPQNCKILQNFN